MLSPSRKMVPTSPLFPVETEDYLRAVLQVRIHLAPAGSPLRTQFVQRRLCRCSARASVNIAGPLANETTMPVSRTP